jgi:dipeptidyl aminopeptidase/acylaminoacyl peptidase
MASGCARVLARSSRIAALCFALSLAAIPSALAGARLTPRTSYLSPETLNSHVIFSRACSTIVYTSNRDGPLRPFIVDMKDPSRPRLLAVDLAEPGDFVAQSLAPDCRNLALVSDHNGDGLFAIYLYRIDTRTLQNITSRPQLDEGNPIFAPRGGLLAYLSDGRLALYDCVKSQDLVTTASPARFQSFAWSEDGAALFLDDERTNIWRYDLKSRLFSKIWTSPRMSYSHRMLSQRGSHLLFVSDHESEYSQIYQLDLKNGSLRRLFQSPHDEYSPVEIGRDQYTFRTSTDGTFIAAELTDGKYRALSPVPGVTYDFSLQFGAPLLLYSNDHLPRSLYWLQGDKLVPLLPVSTRSRQPAAIPVKNAQGMTNVLYLPSNAPRAWLIWLHGGPHEQVSPRFNPYFDFLASRNIAVYAINYPGSTGIGDEYALWGQSQADSLAVEVPAVERDIEQLRHLHPEISSFELLGVSYGSILAHLVAAKHPEVTKLVDFSGIANTRTIPNTASSNGTSPPMLFIYGENDPFFHDPARAELISEYAKRAPVTRLVLPNQGHYIENRDAIDRIFHSLDEFLAPAATPENTTAKTAGAPG